MPGFGKENKEIKTLGDLKELVNILSNEYSMNDDAKIDFMTPYPWSNMKVFISGDISYSSNEIVVDCEED